MKPDLTQMKDDMTYINGIEQGIEIVKSIFSLSKDDRKERFGSTDIATILDSFDFVQIQNEMSRERKLVKHYVLRGIHNTGCKKEVVWESQWLEGKPSDAMILEYLCTNEEADFAVLEEVYTAELEK